MLQSGKTSKEADTAVFLCELPLGLGNRAVTSVYTCSFFAFYLRQKKKYFLII